MDIDTIGNKIETIEEEALLYGLIRDDHFGISPFLDWLNIVYSPITEETADHILSNIRRIVNDYYAAKSISTGI